MVHVELRYRAERRSAPGFSPLAENAGWNPLPAAGPSNYTFTPGEHQRYRLTAQVLGSGVEQSNDPMDIALDFGADMALDTQAINEWDEGEMELRFVEVQMNGRFMGSPVQLQKTRDGNRLDMPGYARVTARKGQNLAIPQLEFFDTLIQMRVGKDGQVREVRGAEGFERLLVLVPVMASNRLSDTGLREGAQWESTFYLPIPGLPKPPKARTICTFMGYETNDGRRCAVIKQVLNAEDAEGILESPEGLLGGAMSFTMPKPLLTGNNTLLHDAETGHLARSDIDVHFGLETGRELQGAAQLLGIYGSLLNDIEDGTSKSKLQIDTSRNRMEMGVDIRAILASY